MKAERIYFKPDKEIRISIPDDDMAGWIQVLKEAGFSEEEMGRIFFRTNKTYRRENKNELINWIAKEAEEGVSKKFNVILTDQQKETIRRAVEEEYNNSLK
jgi:hypothetical protein